MGMREAIAINKPNANNAPITAIRWTATTLTMIATNPATLTRGSMGWANPGAFASSSAERVYSKWSRKAATERPAKSSLGTRARRFVSEQRHQHAHENYETGT